MKFELKRTSRSGPGLETEYSTLEEILKLSETTKHPLVIEKNYEFEISQGRPLWVIEIYDDYRE